MPNVDNIENKEEFMISRRGEIMQKLRQLGKKNSLITLHFDNQSMLSTVVDVLADRDLLVLDYGANEELNQKLIKANKAIVKTNYAGIVSQFSIKDIKKARLRGQPNFACALPESILWVQRREAYRVKIPLSENVTCELTHGDSYIVSYPVLDISNSGIALFDKHNDLELEPGTIFKDCKLSLGNHQNAYIDLEIRNNMLINPQDSSEGTRIGCAFLDIDTNFEVSVQKFINIVDIQQKRSE